MAGPAHLCNAHLLGCGCKLLLVLLAVHSDGAYLLAEADIGDHSCACIPCPCHKAAIR